MEILTSTFQWHQMYVSKHSFSILPGCLGDTQFCFRFRQGSNRKSSLGFILETTDRDAPPCLKVCRRIRDFARGAVHQRPGWRVCFVCLFQREQGHYYGYVYFRQVRDKSLKRGYFQKVGDWSHCLETHKIHISICSGVCMWPVKLCNPTCQTWKILSVCCKIDVIHLFFNVEKSFFNEEPVTIRLLRHFSVNLSSFAIDVKAHVFDMSHYIL